MGAAWNYVRDEGGIMAEEAYPYEHQVAAVFILQCSEQGV